MSGLPCWRPHRAPLGLVPGPGNIGFTPPPATPGAPAQCRTAGIFTHNETFNDTDRPEATRLRFPPRSVGTGDPRKSACGVRMGSATSDTRNYSTRSIELRSQKTHWFQFGEPGGTRTHGPKIKSLVLYQLSYGLTPEVYRRVSVDCRFSLPRQCPEGAPCSNQKYASPGCRPAVSWWFSPWISASPSPCAPCEPGRRLSAHPASHNWLG